MGRGRASLEGVLGKRHSLITLGRFVNAGHVGLQAHGTKFPQMDFFMVWQLLATSVPYYHSDKVAGGSVLGTPSAYYVNDSLRPSVLAQGQSSLSADILLNVFNNSYDRMYL